MMFNKKQKNKRMAINGKFLGPAAGHSGVYRVAFEIVKALDKLLESDSSLANRLSLCILVPPNSTHALNLKRIQIKVIGSSWNSCNASLWEQLVLPVEAKGMTLINLCNVGPLMHFDSYTMMHDAQTRTTPKSYSAGFRAWYAVLQPMLARLNKSILTVSEFSKSQLVKFNIAGNADIEVVHNGCDHVMSRQPDLAAAEKFGLSKRKYVIALSSTQEHKNIRILFEAFRSGKLSTLTLALFGPSTREDFERSGFSVPENVEFLGKISDEELSGLLIGALALAFPSLTEGFGLPPLEAMMLGCAVIAAPCGALLEVCGDAALWADPHESESWVRLISKLREDEYFRLDVVNAGRTHAVEFTWEKSAKRLLDVVFLKRLDE